MATILLPRRSPPNLSALVDDEDHDSVMAAGPWWAKAGSDTWYAYRQRQAYGKRRTEHLHTFLTGYPRTDHANGDGLDNRRANLRRATHAENMRNRRGVSSLSPYKGVGWHKSQWRAYIKVGGRFVSLGNHATEADAARAYDAAALEHFGSFARVNFPQQVDMGANGAEFS